MCVCVYVVKGLLELLELEVVDVRRHVMLGVRIAVELWRERQAGNR